MIRDKLIKNARCVVVKVGTSTITNSDGTLDKLQIEKLALQISCLREKGKDVIVVTSGAIGAGMAVLGLKKRPNDISGLQACAAVGQGRLIETYAESFKKHKYIVAQILLTAEDFRSRVRFLNARNTLLKLLEENVIPIVNENDTVVVSEIKFGDNDKLSALVANLVQADLLVILSDVEGLYDEKKVVIERVQKVTGDIESLCCGKGSALSTGGMQTKLEAAKIVTRAGEGMIIANGRRNNVLIDIFNGEKIGTFFEPHTEGLTAKKRWLAFFTKIHGSIIVDKGAEEALSKKGKSLLASGVVGVRGSFKVGDTVNIIDLEGRKFACGLVNYNNEEIEKIKGLKTSQIEMVLKYKTSDEVIHRDNMSIL
jgi:glutamate 5-kinase